MLLTGAGGVGLATVAVLALLGLDTHLFAALAGDDRSSPWEVR